MRRPRSKHGALGVRHRATRPINDGLSPLRRALALRRRVLSHPTPLNATQAARQFLDGRTGAVASILLRAGALLETLERSPGLRDAVGLPENYLDHPHMTWRYLQQTVRRGVSAEQWGRAAAQYLRDAVIPEALLRSEAPPLPRGMRSLTFLYEARDIDGETRIVGTAPRRPEDTANAERLVAQWVRWMTLRTQDLATQLQRRRGGHAASYAAAAGGASLRAIAAHATSARHTPPDVVRALQALDAATAALRTLEATIASSGVPAVSDASDTGPRDGPSR